MVLVSFVFSLKPFFHFDLQMHKTHKKALFSELCLLEITVRTFISLMTKFEVYNVLASKLDHFKNYIPRHFVYPYLNAAEWL